MSFQGTGTSRVATIPRSIKNEQKINFAPQPVDLIDADFDGIVAAARAECADFFSGLGLPGFRSGGR